MKTAMRAVMLILMMGIVGVNNTNAQRDHDYVDLGLPSGTLWATCNIGASVPEGYGDYFGLSVNDYATSNWGANWCMPTYDEWVELYQCTTYTLTSLNGVNGLLFRASNGNSIFLPCAGQYDSEYDIWGEGSECFYWSSTALVNPYKRWYFHYNTYYNSVSMENGYDDHDMTIRPVRFRNNVPTGAINGRFTINSDGNQVCFSKGNLQYIGSAYIPYWKFADNQWEYLGTSTGQNSASEDVDRDLFGWATSGYNHGATYYQPWCVYQSYSYYYAYGDYTYNLYDQTGRADWGYNRISNGGNSENQWRTLTKTEWYYVLMSRVTSSGIRFAKAQVNDINGIIILPDGWNTSTYSLNNTNDSKASCSSNTISAVQWLTLENAGAVFLPTGGSRKGTTVNQDGSLGCYWTSSTDESVNNSYSISFNTNNIYMNEINEKYFGRSVRLVCSAPTTYIFSEAGSWNNTDNWIPNELPSTVAKVLIRANAIANVDATIQTLTLDENVTLTINSDVTLTVTGTITQSTGSNIIIENGGKLVNATSGITATVKKSITQWTTSPDNGWHAISSPVTNVVFANVENLTSSEYNVYRLNETNLVWENSQNSSHDDFTSFENGRGYLYRKGDNTAIEFNGTLNAGTIKYPLSYTSSTTKGFHLIGNPYPHNIYKGAGAAIPNTYLEEGFYTLTSAGGWVAGTDHSTAIAPCQAILVQALSSVTNEKLTFTNTTATGTAKSLEDNIMFVVSNSDYEDVAYAVFKKGHGLNKIEHRNEGIQKLYIQHNGEDFAIANIEEDVQAFNLNFHATTTGKYTMKIKATGSFNYLHLIDNITGEDIDLLLEDEYSFIGASSDNDNRFIVKLRYTSSANNDDELFAYQNGNEFMVRGEGTLQIFDALGRHIMTKDIFGFETVNVSSLQTGVYILRMISDNIKTQKIIVK